jgi:uncharacterized membrane protein YgcG
VARPVLAVLHGAQLAGFLDGTNKPPAEKIQVKKQLEKAEEIGEVPNPALEVWKAQEQQVLSYLLTSVSRDVLIQVVVLQSAIEGWKHIEGVFASQSRARVINTHMALATTQKGSSNVAEYISKMKTLADDMASIGKKLDDEEFDSYILTGLDSDYDSVVSSIAARTEPISFDELYSQLLAHENRLNHQNGGQGSSQSSVNNASRGRGGFSRGHGGHGRGGGNSAGHGTGDPFNKSKNEFPPCQLYGRTNHAVFKCYKHFDPHYMGEHRSVNGTNSYGVDSNWYTYSGATYHVTGELDKLAMKEAYHGGDQIYTTSGLGMHFKHIGHSIIHTPH